MHACTKNRHTIVASMQPQPMGDRCTFSRVSKELTLHGQQWKCALMPRLQVKGDAFDIVYFCIQHVARPVSALSCSINHV